MQVMLTVVFRKGMSKRSMLAYVQYIRMMLYYNYVLYVCLKCKQANMLWSIMQLM